MTLEETAKDLNSIFKKQNDKDQYIKTLEDRINRLEEVLDNVANRLNYIERRCE